MRAGALGVENCSEGRTTSAPAALPLGSGRNNTNAIGKHCPVASEAKHEISHDAPHGTVVMIGVGGGVSLPFLHFHVAPNDARRSRSQPHKF